MAIFVDPAQGALGQAFGKGLGDVLDVVNRKKNREKELAANPQVLANLAPAARRAIEAGQLEAFARALEVRPEYVQSNIADAFQPDTAELKDVAFRKGKGVEATVGAEIGTAKVAELEATTILETGIIPKKIGNEISKLNLDSQYYAEQTKLGFPSLKARSEVAGFKADTDEAGLRSEYATIALKDGLPQIRVDTERLKGLYEQKNIGMASRAIDTYEEYINTLPNTPLGNHFRAMAAAGIANPNFPGHVMQHEQLDAAAASTLARNTGNESDMLLNLTRWRTALNDAIDRAKVASGDEEKELAIRDVNMLKAYGQSMIVSGAMLPVEITGARKASTLLGFRSKVETFGVKPEYVDRLTQAAQMVIYGENSLQELQASPMFKLLPKDAQIKLVAVIASGMSEREQEQEQEQVSKQSSTGGFSSNFETLLHDRGVPPAMNYAANALGTKFGAFLVNFGSKGFTPPSSDDIYNQLSPTAQASLDNFRVPPDSIGR